MSTGTPLGRMVIELGLDDTDFGKGVEGAKKKTTYLSKEMQANMKIADLAGDKMGKLGAKYDGLGKIIDAQQQKVNALSEAYNKSFDENGKATDATLKYANQLQQANGQLAGYHKQLANTAGEMAALSVKTEGVTGKLYSFGEGAITAGDKMKSIGDKWTVGVTTPLVAGIGLVTKEAMNWESAFAGVKKTNDEVVNSNGEVVYSYDDLEQGLRNLSKELPATHDEIAGVAEAAGQLGIQTESVTSFTKTMIDLGESTNMSAEEAATSIARLANITGMSEKDFDKLGSTIVDLGNNMATTESEITEMALKLAGAGSQVGMTEAEILSFAAALSSVGIEAQAGGTAFSKVMIQMQLAVEKGSNAFDELKGHAEDQGVAWESVASAVRNGGKELTAVSKEMGLTSSELKKMYKEAEKSAGALDDFSNVAGMTSEQFSKLFKDNPSQAIIEFVDGLSKAEEQGTSAIKVLDDMGITEVRLRDALLRAAGASDVFTDAIEMGTNAWDENTALTEEAEKRYETTEAQLAILKNQVKDVAITFGGPFLKALNSSIQTSKPFIENMANLAEKFADADPKTQKMIMSLIKYAVVAGPALSITGRLTKGIGGMTKGTIDFLAQMAKKRTVKSFTKALADGAVDSDTLSAGLGVGGKAVDAFATTAVGGAGKTKLFGTAMSTAAGTQGAGALTMALGSLGPVILGTAAVVGIGGVGYLAWKQFGESAWNSSRRVKEWGSDVGVVTAETLGTVQTHTQEASGQFSLMAQGFENDTPKMIENFGKIGATIENDLTRQIDAFRESVELLPEEVKAAGEKIADEAAESREKTLELVKENNERILQIKKEYVDKDGNVTAQGTKMIQDLMRQSTEEYLKITVQDADDRMAVMEALNGDVETASKKQAKTWVESLAQQRRSTKEDYTERLEEYKQYLDNQGILNTQEGQQMVELFEKARDTSTDAFDAQMAIIAEKYPELAKEISFATGQMINENNKNSEYWIENNKKIIAGANKLSDQLAETAKKNATQIAWTADEATEAGRIWNGLQLIDKEGNVKSNAKEIITEATKDTDTWNRMRLVIHDANIDSNAKKIIGEAAIENGYWDGMAWEDKKAILQDEFSITMYEAVREAGKWDELSIEAKQLLVKSNTPETLAEAMLQLGLWEEFQPDIKDLDADNYDLLNILYESEEKWADWNEMPSDVKELLGDNYDLLAKIYESEASFEQWEKIPENEKRILANNQDVLAKIFESEESMNLWNVLPSEEKELLADNQDLLSKVVESEESMNAWNVLPEQVKNMLANNVDVLQKVQEGVISTEEYNKIAPALKLLTGDSSGVVRSTSEGERGLNSYGGNNPGQKLLEGRNDRLLAPLRESEIRLNIFDRNNPSNKSLVALDNASYNADVATNAVDRFRRGDSLITKTLEVITRYRKAEKGTMNHDGSLAMVNDQKGSLYKELIELPTGQKFIPEGRDVMLPLPEGSKVFTAAQTKSIMSNYSNGIGVPKDAKIVKTIDMLNANSKVGSTSGDNGVGELKQMMKQMLNAISRLDPTINVYPTWENVDDIRKTSRDLAFLTQLDERGSLQ